MSGHGEAVLNNAVIWAHAPMKKISGGMRISQGRIAEIFGQDKSSRPDGPSIDLKGMHVIPGLIDAHRHFFISALLPHFGDAASWTSRDDALAAIEAACRKADRDKGWVFFSGLDHTGWRIPCLPRLKEIDAVARGVPVLAADMTFHKGIISTEAAKRSGTSRDRLRCPDDMDLERDGTLKGTIWEDAFSRVLFAMYREVFQKYSEAQKRKIIIDEAERCLKKGLTHVHDPGLPRDVQMLLKDAQDHTPLKMSWSITAYDSMFAPPDESDEVEALTSVHAPRSVKFFLDGAFRTAAEVPVIAGLKAAFRAGKDCLRQKNLWPVRMLFEQKMTIRNGKLYLPYLRHEDLTALTAQASYFSERGYRLVIHALGNVAARQAVELLNRTRPVGASVEHMLVMDEEGLDLFARCGAVASIQPGFIPYYAEAIERQGALPYLKAFALKSLSKRGVDVCISSDGPCAADDPLHNIRRAVDRKKPDGSVLDPDESLSEADALSAGTVGGSLSMGLKNDGLTEGAPATFCVVDGDPFSDRSRVVQTWIDGRRAC